VPGARVAPALELLLSDPFLQMEDDGFSYGDRDGDYASMYNYQPAACLEDRHAGGSNGSLADYMSAAAWLPVRGAARPVRGDHIPG
jgi:hypothetical protein